MKITLVLFSLFYCFSSFANFNEFECQGKIQDKTVFVEIEQAFPQGTYFKNARLTVGNDSFDYTVSTRVSRAFNNVEYISSGFKLEIDFWPDQSPRWGQTYKGRLVSSELSNQSLDRLSCSFVGI